MALMPKRTKHRKVQRGRIRGYATRGNRVNFGDFGLQSLDAGWITGRQIDVIAKRVPFDCRGAIAVFRTDVLRIAICGLQWVPKTKSKKGTLSKNRRDSNNTEKMIPTVVKIAMLEQTNSAILKMRSTE